MFSGTTVCTHSVGQYLSMLGTIENIKETEDERSSSEFSSSEEKENKTINDTSKLTASKDKKPTAWDRLAATHTISSRNKVDVCSSDEESYETASTASSNTASEQTQSPKTPRITVKSTSNKFFERLASTDTFASSGLKEQGKSEDDTNHKSVSFYNVTSSHGSPSPRTVSESATVNSSLRTSRITVKAQSNRFFERLASADTFASSGLKDSGRTQDDRNHKSVSFHRVNSFHGSSSHIVSKSAANSIFDRLASTETISSSGLKDRHSNNESKKKSSAKPSSLEDDSAKQQFFQRLASADTFASLALKEREEQVIKKETKVDPRLLVSNNISPIFERLANTETALLSCRKSIREQEQEASEKESERPPHGRGKGSKTKGATNAMWISYAKPNSKSKNCKIAPDESQNDTGVEEEKPKKKKVISKKNRDALFDRLAGRQTKSSMVKNRRSPDYRPEEIKKPLREFDGSTYVSTVMEKSIV